MPIQKGNKVKLDYEGRFETGEIFDTSKHGDHSHPLEFEAGSGKVIPGFDEAVIGLEKDQEKEFTIPPEKAYGMPNPQLKQKIPRTSLPPLPEGMTLKPGLSLAMKTPDGHTMPATIAEVSDTEVTLDLNHPLAGKTLIFKIRILDYS